MDQPGPEISQGESAPDSQNEKESPDVADAVRDSSLNGQNGEVSAGDSVTCEPKGCPIRTPVEEKSADLGNCVEEDKDTEKDKDEEDKDTEKEKEPSTQKEESEDRIETACEQDTKPSVHVVSDTEPSHITTVQNSLSSDDDCKSADVVQNDLADGKSEGCVAPEVATSPDDNGEGECVDDQVNAVPAEEVEMANKQLDTENVESVAAPDGDSEMVHNGEANIEKEKVSSPESAKPETEDLPNDTSDNVKSNATPSPKDDTQKSPDVEEGKVEELTEQKETEQPEEQAADDEPELGTTQSVDDSSTKSEAEANPENAVVSESDAATAKPDEISDVSVWVFLLNIISFSRLQLLSVSCQT